MESGKPFRIQVAGERIRVPSRAEFSVAHERDVEAEEVEFQFKWTIEADESDSADDAPVV